MRRRSAAAAARGGRGRGRNQRRFNDDDNADDRRTYSRDDSRDANYEYYDADRRDYGRRAAEREAERSGGFRIIQRADGSTPGKSDDDGDDRMAFGSAFDGRRSGGDGRRGDVREGGRGGRGGRESGYDGRGRGGRGREGGRGGREGRGGRSASDFSRRGRDVSGGGDFVRSSGYRDEYAAPSRRYDDDDDGRREDDRQNDAYGSDRRRLNDDDDDWLLEGLEDELEEGRRWAQGKDYLPELLSKYVEDDFEPIVYTREPDDLDEYSFFSGARFGQLGASDEVRESLRKSFKIDRPSHIQAQSYRVLSGETSESSHVLLADQAGSGKTLAYLLPLLQRLQQMEAERGRSKPKRPRLLVLTPTSELATQVREVVKQLSFGGLRSRSLLANNVSKPRTQIEALMDGVDIVVGTPGRVVRLIEEGKMETADVDAVVLDECDVLLGDSFEFAEQVAPIRNAVPPSAQFVLVTATIPDDVLKQLKDFFNADIRVVQGPGLHRPSAGMLERLIDCSGGEVFDDQSGFYRKFKALMDLLEVDRAERTLLFCNKIDTCRKIENMLTRADRDGDKYKILPYHAALSRELGQRNLKEFMTSNSKTPLVLVCTDRASRGLDASKVKHVILFDFPRDPSEYVRRVGRTARGAMGQGRVSVLVLGRQVRLAREIMRRNDRGDPVEATPTNY